MAHINLYILNLKRIYSKKVQNLTFITLLMVARKTFFNVTRDIGDYSTSIDSTTSLALICIALSLFVINTNRTSFRHVYTRTESFVLCYFLSLLSFIWAGNVSTILFKGIEVLCSFFVVGMTLYNIKSQRHAFYYIILLSTLVSLVDILNHIWKVGVSIDNLHTNAYTVSAMIGLLCSLGAIHVKLFTFKELKYFAFLNSVAVAIGTSSATYIAAIIGILLIYSSGKRKIYIVFTLLMCLIAYVFYLLLGDYIYEIIFYGKNKESVESGTGRQYIWEACIEKWKTSPWLGTGFVVGERDIADYGTHVVRAVSAHNSFLSVLVGTGVVGMFVFVRFLYLWFINMYRYVRYNRYATVLFSTSVAVMVNCNSFPAIGSDWNYVAPCVFALIAFVFINLKRWED